MKKIIAGISLLMLMLSFFATAYADVPDPYGRPRPRPHPHINRPGIRVSKIRDAAFEVANGKQDNSFILKVTLPGPCDWHFSVYDYEMKELFVSDMFFNGDINRKKDEKVFALTLPENGEGLMYTINAEFVMNGYVDTRFGPKLTGHKGARYGLRKEFVLKREDGRYTLQKF